MNILKKFFPLNKWGQGMRARWFAFLILIALFAWGSYSAYSIMYTHLGWQMEVPNPRVDINEEVECPVPDCNEPIPASELQARTMDETFIEPDQTGGTFTRKTKIKANESTCHVCGYQRDGSGIPWAAVASLVVFLLFFFIAWRIAHGTKGSNMFIETEQELKKVVWPSKVRILNSSIVVVLTMVIIATILFVADIAINMLIRNVLNLW